MTMWIRACLNGQRAVGNHPMRPDSTGVNFGEPGRIGWLPKRYWRVGSAWRPSYSVPTMRGCWLHQAWRQRAITFRSSQS